MNLKFNLIVFLFFPFQSYAQLSIEDSLAKEGFLKELKLLNRSFNAYFNSNMENLYGADEKTFIGKIDSLRNTFLLPLNKLKTAHPQTRRCFF